MSDKIKTSYIIPRSKEYYSKFKQRFQRTQKKINRNKTTKKKIKELKTVLIYTHSFYTSIIDWNI